MIRSVIKSGIVKPTNGIKKENAVLKDKRKKSLKDIRLSKKKQNERPI